MGLFGKVKSVLVVDTAAVLKTKGVRGRAAPRQQLQILRSLSRFVQRENLKVIAVLAGDPLDKAPHNKVFEGVRVRYAKSEEALDKELLKALKQAGSAGVLVTDEVALETRVLRAGGSILRVSTFRKLLDDGIEQNESDRGNNNNNRPQRNRRDRDRDRGPRPPNRNNNQQQQQRPQADETEEQNSGEDTISQMIDLVE
ncbi:MAG TPA: hypothetical protein PLD51_00720 [Pontiellaceae bacterium]|nr:hypothetical protein [Pontiellaceae bacterium]HPR82356.1 hypothetical protein [Pontiellaceae bacterium]